MSLVHSVGALPHLHPAGIWSANRSLVNKHMLRGGSADEDSHAACSACQHTPVTPPRSTTVWFPAIVRGVSHSASPKFKGPVDVHKGAQSERVASQEDDLEAIPALSNRTVRTLQE